MHIYKKWVHNRSSSNISSKWYFILMGEKQQTLQACNQHVTVAGQVKH